jgi:condensin complex subunit 2
LDFTAFDERDMKDIDKELFAPVTRGAGINLPGIVLAKAGKKSVRGKKVKARTKEKKDDHLLPDDMHFSSRQLVTLFLKPKFSVCHYCCLGPLCS